jgi:hypothetical protein
MKRALVHGGLLVVMLIVAFVTWTADEQPETEDALTTVWEDDPEAVTSLQYRSRSRTIAMERRTVGDATQLWAVETDLAPPAPRDTAAAGSPHHSARSIR